MAPNPTWYFGKFQGSWAFFQHFFVFGNDQGLLLAGLGDRTQCLEGRATGHSFLPPRTKGAGVMMGLCCTEHSSMYEEVGLSLSTTKLRGGSGGELARQERNQS